MKKDSIRQTLESLGIPDDLPDVVLEPSTEWSRARARRIENMTRKRARKGLSVANRTKVLTLAIFLVFLAVVGYGAASAGWQQILTYIPGFGIRPMEEEARVLAQPLSVEEDGWLLQVSGVHATAANTTVNLRMRPPEGHRLAPNDKRVSDRLVHRPTLMVEGMTLEPNSLSMAFGQEWVARIDFPPLPSDAYTVQLTIPEELGRHWNVEMALEVAKAEDVFWHSHMLADIPVAVGTLVTDQEVVVTVQVRLSDTPALTQLGFSSLGFSECRQENMSKPPDVHPSVERRELALPVRLLVGEERIVPRWCEGYVQGDVRYLEYRFALDGEAAVELVLEVPALVMVEPLSTQFIVPVAASGSIQLDKSVSWGDHTLILTHSERREKSVRIYLEQPDDAAYPLVELDIKTLSPEVTGSSYTTDRETGRVMFLELPIDDPVQEVRLQLSRPHWLVEERYRIELAR